MAKNSTMARKRTVLGRRLFILVGVVAVAALVVYGNSRRASEGKGGVPVRTAAVTEKDITLEISAKGVVEAEREMRVRSEISGLIERVTVEIGDEVKRGQPLIFFDAADLATRREEAEHSLREAESTLALLMKRKENWMRSHQAELEQARAQLEQVRIRTKATEGLPPWEEDRVLALEELREAEARVKLIEAQVESERVTDEEIAAAEASISSARATLERARDAISKSVVRSPADGVVTAVRMEEGDAVSQGSVLIEVADLNVLRVGTKVDEIDIGRIKVKAPAQITSKAYPDLKFEGSVSEISPKAVREDNVGYFDVMVELSNASASTERGMLKPGMSVDVRILTEQRSGVLVISAEAVLSGEEIAEEPDSGDRGSPGAPEDGQRDTYGKETSYLTAGETGDNRSFVFVEEEGIARLREVRLGIDTGTEVEVLDGLSAGEVLIVGDYETLRNLKDGDKVKRVTPEETTPKER